jgi:hypothetical protein
MQKTCVHRAIENMVETKMHGTVCTKIDFFTLWECVKHAILVITTKYVYFQFYNLFLYREKECKYVDMAIKAIAKMIEV